MAHFAHGVYATADNIKVFASLKTSRYSILFTYKIQILTSMVKKEFPCQNNISLCSDWATEGKVNGPHPNKKTVPATSTPNESSPPLREGFFFQVGHVLLFFITMEFRSSRSFISASISSTMGWRYGTSYAKMLAAASRPGQLDVPLPSLSIGLLGESGVSWKAVRRTS